MRCIKCGSDEYECLGLVSEHSYGTVKCKVYKCLKYKYKCKCCGRIKYKTFYSNRFITEIKEY